MYIHCPIMMKIEGILREYISIELIIKEMNTSPPKKATNMYFSLQGF